LEKKRAEIPKTIRGPKKHFGDSGAEKERGALDWL